MGPALSSRLMSWKLPGARDGVQPPILTRQSRDPSREAPGALGESANDEDVAHLPQWTARPGRLATLLSREVTF